LSLGKEKVESDFVLARALCGTTLGTTSRKAANAATNPLIMRPPMQLFLQLSAVLNKLAQEYKRKMGSLAAASVRLTECNASRDWIAV
jgi:hypothetical protein